MWHVMYGISMMAFKLIVVWLAVCLVTVIATTTFHIIFTTFCSVLFPSVLFCSAPALLCLVLSCTIHFRFVSFCLARELSVAILYLLWFAMSIMLMQNSKLHMQLKANNNNKKYKITLNCY